MPEVRYLEAPIRGESPYKDVLIPAVPGNDSITIYAGREVDTQDQHWEIVRGLHHLTCSADVANRQQVAKLYAVLSGSVETWIWGYLSAAAITASQVAAVTLSPESNVTNVNDYVAANYSQSLRMGRGELLFKGVDKLIFTVGNGQAADVHFVHMTFKYKNYEMGITQKC